tara:strand:+ start:16658 stop:19000 length:2343 start_codon:yes stop_codon:yes gene_type:complete
MTALQNNSNQDENDGFNIVKEAQYYLFFWPWFLLSFLIFTSSSYIYLRYAETSFITTATLQVKDGSSDPSSFLSQRSGTMFNFNRTKIDNYVAQIKANQNISNVIETLDLRTIIYNVGRIKKSLVFGDEIPFRIEFKKDDFFDQIILNLKPNNSSIEFGEEKITFDSSFPFETEDFILTVNEFDDTNLNQYLILRASKQNTFYNLSNRIQVSSSSKEGDNLDISIIGSNISKNEAIINSLINTAHISQIKDKQEIFTLSIDFINDRLVSIKNEIDSLSFQTIGFKSENLIFSAETQTSAALSSISTIEDERFMLETQKLLAQSLKKNLEDQEDFSLLPSNIGLTSGNVNELVLSYNEMVLNRKSLLAGATTKNPLIIQISRQLNDLKNNIFTSINNYISSINTSLQKFKELRMKTSKEVSKIPGLEVSLLGFERKLQIAEMVYMFLLERREEASISYESTVPNTRVINYANTNIVPIAPRKNIIIIGSIFISILLPGLVFYILKIIDSKIHSRDNLLKLIPNLDILGEVPFNEDVKSINDPRGIFAESARVIRSNISFKLPNKNGCSVILSTSSIKGEGKTISAYNIAASYAAAGEKVLLIGGDLRNPQIHKILNFKRKSNEKGLVNLILNSTDISLKDYIQYTTVFKNKLNFILSGPIPPNPAELLSSLEFSNLLNRLKQHYDYIVIDSAPLVLVSDTIPILKQVDLVVYTVRAHYTDKKLTTFINDLVTDKKVNKIGIILNGIKAIPNSSYYKYGYGYRYSYQYKYNYGYGYGYGSKK